MNFIISLFKYKKYKRVYEYIIIIINRLFKKRKFIPLDIFTIKVII